MAPNPQITNKENENVQLTSQALTSDLSKYMALPLRPDYGEGEQFVLRTNYFDVQVNMKLELFKYDVTIEPTSEGAQALQNSRKRRQFYKLLFEEVSDFQMRGAAIATDYANTLITCGRLFDEFLPEKNYHQVYRGEYEHARGENDPPRPREQKYRVTVKPRGIASISEIMRYIRSEPTDISDFTSRHDATQALNIIMAGAPNKDATVFQSGQNKFYQYPRNEDNRGFAAAYGTWDLGSCLIAVRGYYSSIRTSTSRILLNLNAQCSPFYPEINLLELMQRFGQSPQDLEDFIKKLRVRTEYTQDGKQQITRMMTIRGFSHPWIEDLDGRGNLRYNSDRTVNMKGTKGVDRAWGTAEFIQFACDAFTPARMLSVRAYFQQSDPPSMRRWMDTHMISSPSRCIEKSQRDGLEL